MKSALLQVFTKDGSKLDGASLAARQCWVEGLHESKVYFSAATAVQPSRAHVTGAFHLAKPQQQQSCFSPDSSILCECTLCLLCLGKGWLPSPCILIHIPVLSPSQILGVGFIYYLAIPGLTFHFYLSVSSSSCSLFISQDISCMYLLLFFFFSFLHELQFSKAFECFRFISAFSDLWDLAIPAFSSFSIRDRFLPLNTFGGCLFLPGGSTFLSYHFPLVPAIYKKTLK